MLYSVIVVHAVTNQLKVPAPCDSTPHKAIGPGEGRTVFRTTVLGAERHLQSPQWPL